MPLPEYYKLDLSQAPNIRFVLNHKRDNYRINFSHVMPHVFEIVFLQEGTISEMVDGQERTYQAGTVHTFVQDHPVVKYSHDPHIQEFTIGLSCGSACLPMTADEVAAWVSSEHEAIIPTMVEDKKLTQQLEELIKKVVRSRRSGDAGRFLSFWSHIYHILHLLTEYSVSTVLSEQKNAHLRQNKYCRRACNYIGRHLSEDISVRQVAEFVGISYGYLSSLFSRTMGISIVEYINRTKLDTVKQLIREMNMTLEEAGASVGISDPKYLSRLFRRYVGMTVHEYKKIHR